MRLVRTRFSLTLNQQIQLVFRISFMKSALLSLRWRRPILIGRGCHLTAHRRSKIVIARRSLLLIGLAPANDPPAVIELMPGSTLSVDGVVSILRGATVRCGWDARLSIGDRAYVNSGARIVCDHAISIAAECAIAFDVLVMDSDVHQLVLPEESEQARLGVELAERCWVGAKSVILKGTKLPRETVVAAGSVVTAADFPEQALIGGVPARLLREGVEWRY